MPKDLVSHNCLDHCQNLNYTWKFLGKNQIKEIRVKGNLRVDSSIDLKNLALSDAGIVYLPSFTVFQEIQTESLISILENFQAPKIEMYAVYPSKADMDKKTQLFLKFLLKILKPIIMMYN